MTKDTTNDPTVDNVSIDNIDDFLPMPGADSIVTSEEDDNGSKPNMFSSNNKPVNMDFLDEDPAKRKNENEDEDTISAIAELDTALESGDDDDDDLKSKPGRKKTDKSGLVDFLKKRIEGNEMFAFDDYDDTKQSLDEYLGSLSEKDVEDLWKANVDNMKNEVAAATPKEFFESLPEELQYAAEYVAKGGQDLKGLFRALAQVEEVRTLDPRQPEHQEMIVRQYLQASGFGNGDQELIEDQIQEWFDNGNLQKKALQFQPKLNDMQEEVVQAKLAQQESFKQEQQAKKEAYMQNIYETLKPAELNGVKIDNKRQKMLWDELTTVKYESLTGRPTNLLGKLLEDYQFGQKPRYDLIAETLWLLSDPDDYKESIRKQAKNEVVQDTVKKLKTEEARKLSSYVKEEVEEKTTSKKLSKPQNIFSRR
jgi:hypothetical protein